MQLKKAFLFVLLFIVFKANSQPFTNNWVDFNNSYYKIKIGETGIYAIDYNDMHAYGVPLHLIDPRDISIFYRGKEIPIIVVGEEDSTFNTTDIIKFLGLKNNGDLDSSMYFPKSHPHNLHSLYTDTSTYFLTWTNGKRGLRYAKYANPISTGIAEPYYIHEETNLKTNSYYAGFPVGETTLSNFVEGEGWFGSRQSVTNDVNQPPVQNNANLNENITISNLVLTGPPAKLEISMYGVSEGITYIDPLGRNHHWKILHGKTANSLIQLTDTLIKGYKRLDLNYTLATSALGTPTTMVRFTIVDDINVSADSYAIAFVKMKYPRTFALGLKTTTTFTHSSAATNLRFDFPQYGPVGLKAKPVLLDLTNNVWMTGQMNATTFSVSFPNAVGERKYFLFDDSVDVKKISNFAPVNFVNHTTSTASDYIIITHSSLLSASNNHASYRRTATGGNHIVRVVDIDELYDQFMYGLHHPLAIRNFTNYIIKTQTVKPQYLLLVGKGYSLTHLRANGANNVPIQFDLMPTFGNPPSDILLTSGLDSSRNEPELATGRITAATNSQAEFHLAKIRDFESSVAKPELWHKNVMHISGAKDIGELNTIINYQRGFYSKISPPPFGALDFRIDKVVNSVSTSNSLQDILNRANSGISMLSYFGHGSTTLLSVDIGKANNYNNKGKAPLMFFNGCSVGNAFTTAPSMGEEFTLYPSTGASGWFAHSSLGYLNELGSLMSILYDNIGTRMYGAPFGLQLKDALKRYQATGDYLNMVHIQQAIFLGDPAFTLPNFSKSDLVVENNGLFIDPINTTALTDSFTLAVIVKNVGRATNDSIWIRVTRKLDPDTSVFVKRLRVKAPLNIDTFYFGYTFIGIKAQGLNRFDVFIDELDEIDEFDNVVNNQATFQYFMPSNGVNLLFPRDFGIVSNDSVTLTSQSSDLKRKNTAYFFEIDTVITFNSAYRKSLKVNPTENIADAIFKIQSKDSTVYYWRSRLDLPTDSGGFWVSRSFTYIKGSAPGWSQSHRSQLTTITALDEMVYDSLAGNLNFGRLRGLLTIVARRWGTPGMGLMLDNVLVTNIGGVNANCTNRSVVVVDLDPCKITPSNYERCNNPSRTRPYKAFDMSIANERKAFVRHLMDTIKTNHHVAVYSYYTDKLLGPHLNVKLWEDSVFIALSRIGADTAAIRLIRNDSTVLGIIGQKGMLPGQAAQKTIYSPIPSVDSVMYLNAIAYGCLPSGSYISTKIGPSQRWGDLSFKYNNRGDTIQADSVYLSVIGINKLGVNKVIFNGISSSPFILNQIDANEYPNLRVKAYLFDDSNFTAPHLKMWSVTYDTPPEGSIILNKDYTFYKDTIQEGDSISLNWNFRNVSKYNIDSFLVYYSIIDKNRNDSLVLISKQDILKPYETRKINFKYPTKGYLGNNTLSLNVKLDSVNYDFYTFNNLIKETYFVKKDDRNPFMDVTFDGKRINKGDYVSPSPTILISVKDENPYFNISDTANFFIKIKKPGSFAADIIDFTNPQLSLNPSNKLNLASVSYLPKNLEDGDYELNVETKDASGNASGTIPYSIEFKVVNESMISNFYPYPNPFTTNMKFIFTLTGAKVPDDIRVRIYTISGKMIREVTKMELGNLTIGQNISQFSWDGTDQFGDRLAKGVYIYKVLVKDNDKSFKRLTTGGDKFFEKDMGKIYLIR